MKNKLKEIIKKCLEWLEDWLNEDSAEAINPTTTL